MTFKKYISFLKEINFAYDKMGNFIKYYIFIVTLIVLAVDFGDRENTIFVQAQAAVNVVQQSNVVPEEPEKAETQNFWEMDYDTMKMIVERRRSVIN